MQTFLPYPGFRRSAAVLDDRRLGKQRVETIQVLRACTREDYGWRHHPAVRMWRGYEEALVRYGLEVVAEWRRRGYADTCAATLASDLRHCCGVHTVRPRSALAAAGRLPWWIGDPALHRSHQSALLRKDPDRYASVFPGVPSDLPYVWPTPSEAAG